LSPFRAPSKWLSSQETAPMSDPTGAAWPHTTSTICYQQGIPNVKILEFYAAEDNEIPGLEIIEKTLQESPGPFEGSKHRYLRLAVITQYWKSAGAGHEKVRQYNISQKDLAKLLDDQGLASFFRQTRVDVVGLFGLAEPPLDKAETPDGEFFAVIYDAFLGLWARYDHERKEWQGIYMVMETSLDFKVIAEELVDFVHTKPFLYLVAAKYTVDFLRVRSGELSKRIVEVERHSGHHDAILRPLPAVYEMMEKLFADASATANLVSYYKIVIQQLANELLRYLSESCKGDDTREKEMKRYIAFLKQRAKSLSAYLSYLERRAERQINAALHLLNQANTSTNLTIAHDTRTIAVASKRDSSSMKILAVVTTAFLPGAFVATLFSSSMFDWFASEGHPVVSGRFWVYWSITVPLTLITMGIWLRLELWMKK
jgi:Mg2+ and Co2+ transporter CorA